jgi:AP-3 complex subunit delta-1
MYLKFPRALRLTFDKLKDKLEDTEVAVVSCAVNVITELANKNAKNYLSMAPKFFGLLTKTSNNWMLIKVAKLLGSLVQEEPRLARKLLDPLVVLMQNTSAKSLQFECISTICTALLFTKREDGSDAKNVPSTVKVRACSRPPSLLSRHPSPSFSPCPSSPLKS